MNILYLLLAVITEILISINYDLQNWILLCCVKIKAYYIHYLGLSQSMLLNAKINNERQTRIQ